MEEEIETLKRALNYYRSGVMSIRPQDCLFYVPWYSSKRQGRHCHHPAQRAAPSVRGSDEPIEEGRET